MEAEAGGSLEFEASVFYKGSASTARAVTQKNHVLNKTKHNKKPTVQSQLHHNTEY